MDSSAVELKDALREALDRNGSLNDVRASLRAAIFKALNEPNVLSKPDLPNETLIINELIREYLVWHNLRETLSVFVPESGGPQARPFDRSFLAEHLHVVDGPNTKQLPLLYNLLAQHTSKPLTGTAPPPQQQS